MFSGCTNIALSDEQTDEYIATWSVPANGNGTDAANWNLNMLTNTGLFTDDPTLNTTYYVKGCTVTFVTNGGSEVETTALVSGATYDLSTFTTIRTNYKFAGWYLDEDLNDAVESLTVTTATTLYAAWTAYENLDDLELAILADYTYDGTEQTVEFTSNITALGENEITFTYSLDGETYSSSVAVKDAGDYTIYYTATCGDETVSGQLDLTVAEATFTDVVATQNGIIYYDGTAQTPDVTVTATAVDGAEATITYCATTYGNYKETLPKYTEEGTHTLYYVISAENHITIYGTLDILVCDVDNCVTFSSDSSFTLEVTGTVSWDGQMEYYSDSTWSTWTGKSALSAIEQNGKYYIYLRGTDNTCVSSADGSAVGYFSITGSDVSCSGNVECLLDYATVAADGHPEMASYAFYKLFYESEALISAPDLGMKEISSYGCQYMFAYCTNITEAPELQASKVNKMSCAYMFSGCTSLETAPGLPATTLGSYCYYYMFQDCTSLTTPSELPAATMAEYCYAYMYYGCTSLKVSEVENNEYGEAWRIPTEETGTDATNWSRNMLSNTGGTFTGTPEINTTYYLPSSAVSSDPVYEDDEENTEEDTEDDSTTEEPTTEEPTTADDSTTEEPTTEEPTTEADTSADATTEATTSTDATTEASSGDSSSGDGTTDGTSNSDGTTADGTTSTENTITDETDGATYTVTATGATPTVTVTKAGDTSVTSVTINTVTIDGTTYAVTAIEANAYANCTALTTVTIGENVTTMGDGAFSGCTALTTVNGCANLTVIPANAFKGCTSLTTVKCCKKVTSIGANAFANCKNLVTLGSKKNVITLPSVEKIAKKAFYKCTSIKKVNATSKKLVSIGASAFNGCKKMTKFVSKSTVLKKIGKKAFYNCKKLKKVTFKTKKLTTKNVKAKAFKGIAKKCTFKVPKTKKSAYKKLFIKKGAKKTIKVKK